MFILADERNDVKFNIDTSSVGSKIIGFMKCRYKGYNNEDKFFSCVYYILPEYENEVDQVALNDFDPDFEVKPYTHFFVQK